MELLNEEFYLNQTTQWSFNFSWKGEGQWGDYNQFSIEIPNQNLTSPENYQPITFKKLEHHKATT